MPEGDTIFRAARTLARALGGREVTGFESVYPALTRVHDDEPLTGRTVTGVRSAGKHLLIEFSGGLVLRTHMRMNGSWHIYRPGERWLRPASAMRLVIRTAEWIAVAFDVPVAEFVRARDLDRHVPLSRLGPDLLSPAFDDAEAVRRLLSCGAVTVSEALLDQRVMAGVGNVFKSEVLFAAGIHPSRPAGSLTAEEASRLVAMARRLLRENVTESPSPGARPQGRRTTRFVQPSAALWVYGRSGRPCRRCGAAIRVRRERPSARLTYWCSECQK